MNFQDWYHLNPFQASSLFWNKLHSNKYERVHWCSGNAVDLYSRGTRFESQPGYWTSLLNVFRVSHPSLQIDAGYFKIGHGRILKNLYLLTVHDHPRDPLAWQLFFVIFLSLQRKYFKISTALPATSYPCQSLAPSHSTPHNRRIEKELLQ
jgi:hypothetical protein